MKQFMSKKRWMLAVVGFASALIVFGWRWMNSPELGTVKTPSSRVINTERVQTGFNEILAKSAKFNIPEDYKPLASPNNPSSTENYQYAESKPGGGLISIMIRPWNLSAKEDSSYKYRLLHSETYTEKTMSASGTEVVGFKSNQGGYEMAVWIPGNGQLATVSLKASNDNGKYDQQLQTILESWQWK